MREIVEAVTRVSDIMSEITAATVEQSSGIDQINLAVAQMDAVTQQNAQLVQQAAESASSLELLATEVNQALAVFQVNAVEDAAWPDQDTPSDPRIPEPAPAVAAPVVAAPAAAAPRLPAAHTTVSARQPAREDEWEEF